MLRSEGPPQKVTKSANPQGYVKTSAKLMDAEYARSVISKNNPETAVLRMKSILFQIKRLPGFGKIITLDNEKTRASLIEKYLKKGKDYEARDRIRATAIIGGNSDKLRDFRLKVEGIIEKNHEGQRGIPYGIPKDDFKNGGKPNGYGDIKVFFRVTRLADGDEEPGKEFFEEFEIILISVNYFLAKSGEAKLIKYSKENSIDLSDFKDDRCLQNVFLLKIGGEGHKVYKAQDRAPHSFFTWHKDFESWYYGLFVKQNINLQMSMRTFDNLETGWHFLVSQNDNGSAIFKRYKDEMTPLLEYIKDGLLKA